MPHHHRQPAGAGGGEGHVIVIRIDNEEDTRRPAAPDGRPHWPGRRPRRPNRPATRPRTTPAQRVSCRPSNAARTSGPRHRLPPGHRRAAGRRRRRHARDHGGTAPLVLAPACLATLHRIVNRAMAPVGFLRELRPGVLGVVYQQVDAIGQLEDAVRDRIQSERRLVVADVGHGRPAPLHPEANRRTAVRNGPDHHPGGPDSEVVLEDVVEDDVASQLRARHGETRRADEVVEHLGQRPLFLLRAEHVETGSHPVGGRERTASPGRGPNE